MDDASVEPKVMPLDLLRQITNGFSEERKLGSGSFGKVYKGVHQDGKKIAVKILYDMPGLDDDQFQNEFKNLTRLRHQNIVRLVGYCHDIQQVQVKHEGKLILAEKTHRALCLEYMSNGSLDKYLSDECDRYDWHKGYRIIKGICQGLKYLHDELKPPIYHLDLKPANVLLDENMVPRIADFGMSRLFGDEQTRATKSSFGTIGYLPPEYIKNNLVSNKFDIFSLGVVIIKIMAGRAGYFNSAEMSSQEFTNLVQENWTNRLLETSNRRNAYSKQVKICIEIGLSCVQEDRHKRPTIQDIVDRLNNTETECTYAARKDWLLIFQEANRNTFPQYAQDSNDRHAEQIYHGSTSNQTLSSRNIVATAHTNYFEQNPGPREARLDDDSRFYKNDNQEYLAYGEKKAPSINSELWHACAGPLVSLPPAGSLVVYFPQGHSEQVAASMQKDVDAHVPNYPNLPSKLICLLHNITLHADLETDEVYAQMTLQPVTSYGKEALQLTELALKQARPQNEFFCKTLTASDTSTHGGFSVPRRSAEKIFPPLDFSMQPPTQEIQARDLHDNVWAFRHIYRGQPKQHLLTTGWSVFVSGKRLFAGDSVIFVRDDRQQLLLGIRRANRQPTNISSSVLSSDSMHIGILAAAARAAANNSPFTIFYNPRASPTEFVIPFAKYQKAVYSNQLSLGMRFRMMFETEELGTRRYMGTITGINDLDPVRWKNSQWRNLQVSWDDSAAGERRNRVSIWEIDLLVEAFGF